MKCLRPSVLLAALLVLGACTDSQPLAGADGDLSQTSGPAEAQGEFQRLREVERGCCPDVEERSS